MEPPKPRPLEYETPRRPTVATPRDYRGWLTPIGCVIASLGIVMAAAFPDELGTALAIVLIVFGCVMVGFGRTSS